MPRNHPASVKIVNDQAGALLTPHPSIYFGTYPTKNQTQNATWLQAAEQRLGNLFEDVFVSSRQHRTMLKRVFATHKFLKMMSDAELDKWVVDIKRNFRRKGLKDELICRAFAIIKQVASRELGMSHYVCQLRGGWIMMQGMIAEMQTGEGKTLTATLPAACAAMAGMPVHVVTVNDYLVKRDAELMGPIYKRLGLTVGCVVEGMDDRQRQQAYRCDITYCTSKQLAFDYLRDRLLLKRFHTDLDLRLSALYSDTPVQDKLLLRGLSFAVVDEADSVLIDEARTPLILSCKTENRQQEALHREAIWLARQMDNNIYYSADTKSKRATLTEQGEKYLEKLTANMHGIWRASRKSRALVQQALTALHCYKKDVNYIVSEGVIQIVDENTGRTMPDRSWEAGLHQMIEEKEECEQSTQNETIARISYQRFFSRYLKLSGMTGTAMEVAGELWRTYGLAVCQVPPHKPSRRRYARTCIYYTCKKKWQAVVKEAINQQALNRPVLIGTRTVKDSEYISKLLTAKRCEHKVLNAKNHKIEAEIVATAGWAGRVTVATNMAGRGTDIKLDAAAKAAGGLHVICCEKNDSRRVDRQLIGRCARQGDPGSCRIVCSLEDDAVVKYFNGIISILFAHKNKKKPSIVRPYYLGLALINASQKIIERSHRQIRKSMMKVDEKRESMLAFMGESE